MITTLHIKNIGIIEDIIIDFNKGLNVLTGETGAGKTLIIDSLQIISGGRFSKEMIRKGENQSFVELCMYEPQNKNAIDGNIIVSREINLNGKNMCKINGRMVTVNELKEFMSTFIEIHGQNDNQNLLENRMHLNYLDGFIGEEIVNQKQKYTELYEQFCEIKQELKNNFGDEKEKQRKLDLLQYQIKEIEVAKLKVNEEEELEEKRKIMANAEKITQNLQEADTLISESGIDSISMAIRALEKIEQIDSKYETVSNQLKSIYYELQELARDVSNYKSDLDFNEEERDLIEERLNLINSLKRKYGNTIQEILNYQQTIQEEVEHIENKEEYNSKLREKQNQIEEKMKLLANQIHKIRKNRANDLSRKINQELEELEMKHAKINVKVTYLENEYLKTGKDEVTFYIVTNKGEEEKELAKIASGGEMSRTMLAIKKVLADSDEMPILVFDEIDTGISGKAANSVANKLKRIANRHQVMCISHLPNIAAMADYNYFISKEIYQDRTKTQIKLLQEDEVIEEIARISAGEINEVSMQYAYELRNKKAC
ncbi:MAG: DNA repair protein RecN [Clostridia bacterium]|nr:DNA repair protein RecN [Clostridia bacterium]